MHTSSIAIDLTSLFFFIVVNCFCIIFLMFVVIDMIHFRSILKKPTVMSLKSFAFPSCFVFLTSGRVAISYFVWQLHKLSLVPLPPTLALLVGDTGCFAADKWQVRNKTREKRLVVASMVVDLFTQNDKSTTIQKKKKSDPQGHMFHGQWEKASWPLKILEIWNTCYNASFLKCLSLL